MPKLTKTLIDNTAAPAQGDTWLHDSEVTGLAVRIQAGGRKTYVARYRTRCAARIARKMTLGRCTDFAPDKARDLARKVFAQVAEGKDPAQEARPARQQAQQATVEALFKGYVAHMRSKGQRSASEVERALLLAQYNAADALGRGKQAKDVQTTDVVALIAPLFQGGKKASADKLRSYVSSAYSWGIKAANDYTVAHRQDWGVTVNPVAAVAKDAKATAARDRNLSAPELAHLWRASEGDGFAVETGALLRVLMACGQRVCETLRLEAHELHLDAREWRMPAEKTKGGVRPHTIPLPDVIIPTLRELVQRRGCGYLFYSRGDTAGPMREASVSRCVKRWCDSQEAAGVVAFQPRDLRRSWKSRAHNAGVDRFTRDLIQQHSKSDTGSKHYDHAEYGPQMREAMDKWSAWLQAAMES